MVTLLEHHGHTPGTPMVTPWLPWHPHGHTMAALAHHGHGPVALTGSRHEVTPGPSTSCLLQLNNKCMYLRILVLLLQLQLLPYECTTGATAGTAQDQV